MILIGRAAEKYLKEGGEFAFNEEDEDDDDEDNDDYELKKKMKRKKDLMESNIISISDDWKRDIDTKLSLVKSCEHYRYHPIITSIREFVLSYPHVLYLSNRLYKKSINYWEKLPNHEKEWEDLAIIFFRMRNRLLEDAIDSDDDLEPQLLDDESSQEDEVDEVQDSIVIDDELERVDDENFKELVNKVKKKERKRQEKKRIIERERDREGKR